MINEIINALVAISTNDANLYRTQHFFRAIFGPGKILEANPVLAPDASVMKTILKAMAYPHSRMKAVEFLKSIAMRGTDVHQCCQLKLIKSVVWLAEIHPIMQEIHLLEKIIELGDGSDYALFAVRTALEDFVRPDSVYLHRSTCHTSDHIRDRPI